MPCYNIPPYNRLQRVLCRPCKLYCQHSKTAHGALQALFLLFAPFYRRRYQTDTSGYNTACSTLERITAPGCTPAHTKYKRYARMLYRSAQPPYYNNVYIRVRPFYGSMPARRGQLLPSVDCWQVLAACQQYRPGAPAEGSASPPVQGQPGSLQFSTGWRPPPGGAVWQQRRGGRRGTIDGYRRISFRAFAR